jgi:hypothetical protein
MYGIVRGQTSRAGRLLAPLSVRFIVVPVIDGGQSTRENPLESPTGLIEALSRQLDLRRRFASPDLVVFENTSWVPVRSQLTPAGATSSSSAGAESMIATDIAGATAFPAVTTSNDSSTVNVQPGTVHLGVPYTSRWKLSVDGTSIPVRPAFGLTNGYDVPAAGTATLSFSTSRFHSTLVVLQVLAWITVAVLATSRRKFRRRSAPSAPLAASSSEPALSFTEGAES